VPALACALAWFGAAVGGIPMGWMAERFGIRRVVMFGAAMVAAGLAISTLGNPAALYIGHGVFIGLLGNACINAPLYVYVARWFDRRRGSAVALISSGQYFAGTVYDRAGFYAVAFATGIVFNAVHIVVIGSLALRGSRVRLHPVSDPVASSARTP